MGLESRPYALDLKEHSIHSRSRSTSSFDCGVSANGSAHSFINPLLDVTPEPAFIAPAAATSIVSGNHSSFLQSEGIEASGDTSIPVTAPALRLINQFLDFLLYSFLSSAKSTSLPALRPAVSQVLRTRFAREAISGADEELQSYLGGIEGDEVDGYVNDKETGDWDIVRAWKRTRIQCMVYSSLGDLEEDDEAAYYEDDHMEGSVGRQQYNRNSALPGVVTPAVAIWLTAILEFVGEQTLLVAGLATISRFSVLCSAAAANGATMPERPMVEELDTEKVALNPSLGRMWRSWRKLLRGTNGSISFSIERRSSNSSRISYEGGDAWREGKAIISSPRDLDPIKQSDQEQESPEETITEPAADKFEEGESPDNLPTTVQETSLDGEEVAGVTDVAVTDTKAKRANFDDERRPKSLVNLPWATAVEFQFTRDNFTRRRPQSLPPLDTSGYKLHASSDSLEIAISEDSNLQEEEEAVKEAEDAEEAEKAEEAEEEELGSDWEDNHIVEHGAEVRVVRSSSQPKLVDVNDSQSQPAEKEGSDGVETPGSARNSSQEYHGEIDLAQPSDDAVKHKAVEAPKIESNIEENRQSYDTFGAIPPFASGYQTDTQESSNPVSPTISESVLTSDEEIVGSRIKIDGNEEKEKSSPASVTSKRSSKSSLHSKHPSSSNTGMENIPERRKASYTTIQTSPNAGALLLERSTTGSPSSRSRRSESFGKGSQRQIHTSGSSNSQGSQKLKAFMTWPTDNGRRHESDDSSSIRSEKLANRLVNMDDKERSFEELIQCGGTIHCTITPDPIRDIHASDSSSIRRTSPSLESKEHVTITKVTNRTIITTIPPINRIPIVTARDARIDDASSARDLALFLRHTGPPETPTMPPRASSSQSTITNTNAKTQKLLGSSGVSAKSSTRLPGQPSPTSISGIPAVMTLQRSESKAGSTNKARLVAREASGSTGDSTSALADFFRNTTPPVDGEQIVTHRISRSVAPFRNTMDSVQFDLARDPLINSPGSSPLEPSFTPNPPHDSYQSSTTSSTALLKSTPRRNEEFLKPAAPSHEGPVRKQRRIMDPYTLDSEDELDEDDLDGLDLILPDPSRRNQEESLMDFLMNAPPPPPQTVQPFVGLSEKKVQKKNSAVSLITRFGRTPSRKSSISSPIDKPSVISSLNMVSHKPIIIENKEAEERGESEYRMRTDTSHNHRPGGNNQRTNYQAKGARIQRDDTTDSLVEFLKYTPPPPSNNTSQPFMSSQPPQKEEGGLTKIEMTLRKTKRKEVAGVV